jgi:hypothetical protein
MFVRLVGWAGLSSALCPPPHLNHGSFERHIIRRCFFLLDRLVLQLGRDDGQRAVRRSANHCRVRLSFRSRCLWELWCSEERHTPSYVFLRRPPSYDCDISLPKAQNEASQKEIISTFALSLHIQRIVAWIPNFCSYVHSIYQASFHHNHPSYCQS